MRVMCITYVDKSSEAGEPPSQELMTRMGTFMEEITKAGVLLSAEGLHPTSKGMRVSYRNGQFTATDGPFAESKEVIAGYAIIKVNSKDEALEWTRRFFEAAGEGEGEVRQVFDAEDFGAEFTPELREQEERQRVQMAANAGQ